MNKREHAVLSLFYDEGHQELTPSFLAYRMRMRTADASALLDGMVRESILDLHIEDEGHISYRLPESEQLRIKRQPQRPTASGTRSPQNRSSRTRPRPDAPTGAPSGTDATPGYAPRNTASEQIAGSRRINDGTDGSVRGFSSSQSSWNQTGPVTTQPDPPPTQTQDQTTHPQQPFPGQGGQLPHHQAMTPYQSNVPAHRPRNYSTRVPVLAGGLSLILPGLGQFYNGEFGKGVLLLFSTTFLLIFNLFFIVWIWSIIDAYMVAEYRNQQALEEDATAYPPRFLPDPQNSNSNAA